MIYFKYILPSLVYSFVYYFWRFDVFFIAVSVRQLQLLASRQYYWKEFFVLCLFFKIWLFWEILKTKDTGVYWSFRWAFPEFVLICRLFHDKLPSIDLQVVLVKPVWLRGYLAQQKKSQNSFTLNFAGSDRTCHWHSMTIKDAITRY